MDYIGIECKDYTSYSEYFCKKKHKLMNPQWQEKSIPICHILIERKGKV